MTLHKRTIKQIIAILMLCVFVGFFALVCFVIFLQVRPDSAGVVVDYKDEQSVQVATQQGILSLEQGEIIVLQTSQQTYRVALLLTNNNNDWQVDRLEYVFRIHGQRIEGVAHISAEQDRLVVIELDSKQSVQKNDVEFSIQRVNWNIQQNNTVQLRAHGNVIQTFKRENQDRVASQVRTNIQNESQHQVHTVHIGAVAYKDDEIIGIGQTTIDTLLAQQDKQVVVDIGSVLYKDITEIIFYINGNVYSGL